MTYIVGQYGVEVVNYLDDLAGAENWDRADRAFETLGTVLEKCGIVESPSKASSPNTRMVFLGVQFDTEMLTLTVTEDRMVETRVMLEEWSDKVSTTRKEVEQLIGKLNYLAACIRPGQVFISRLLNFLRGLAGGNTRHLVPLDFKKDIRWWLKYLSEYNGVSMMAMEEWEQPDATGACDACLAACGGWSEGKYFKTDFPQFIKDMQLHINALELLTIMVMLKLWGKYWTGKRVMLNCDNYTSVLVVNSGRTRDWFMQQCMREILYTAAKHEFEVKCRHIPGCQNRLPDLLSRFHDPKSRLEFQHRTKNIKCQECYVYPGLFNFIHKW